MKQLTAFVLGVALTLALLYAVAGFAQDDQGQIAQPLVISIQQSVPILADVALPDGKKTITATLPLTVEVDLKVAIRGQTITVLTPTQPAAVKVISGTKATDDLGMTYTVDNQVEGLSINEWTAYENTNGYVEFSGEVALAPNGQPADNNISCIVRFYRKGKLVKVEEVANVGFRLEPGGVSQFDSSTGLQPGEADSYTITLKDNR